MVLDQRDEFRRIAGGHGTDTVGSAFQLPVQLLVPRQQGLELLLVLFVLRSPFRVESGTTEATAFGGSRTGRDAPVVVRGSLPLPGDVRPLLARASALTSASASTLAQASTLTHALTLPTADASTQAPPLAAARAPVLALIAAHAPALSGTAALVGGKLLVGHGMFLQSNVDEWML
jgi:hypothetical protein